MKTIEQPKFRVGSLVRVIRGGYFDYDAGKKAVVTHISLDDEDYTKLVYHVSFEDPEDQEDALTHEFYQHSLEFERIIQRRLRISPTVGSKWFYVGEGHPDSEELGEWVMRVTRIGKCEFTNQDVIICNEVKRLGHELTIGAGEGWQETIKEGLLRPYRSGKGRM